MENESQVKGQIIEKYSQEKVCCDRHFRWKEIEALMRGFHERWIDEKVCEKILKPIHE